jgi:hypothetical protein
MLWRTAKEMLEAASAQRRTEFDELALDGLAFAGSAFAGLALDELAGSSNRALVFGASSSGCVA